MAEKWGTFTLLFTALASILGLIAVAEYLGYIVPSQVANWTYTDLGIVAVLFAVLAFIANSRDA